MDVQGWHTGLRSESRPSSIRSVFCVSTDNQSLWPANCSRKACTSPAALDRDHYLSKTAKPQKSSRPNPSSSLMWRSQWMTCFHPWPPYLLHHFVVNDWSATYKPHSRTSWATRKRTCMNILDFYVSIPNAKQKSTQTLGLGISQKLSS